MWVIATITSLKVNTDKNFNRKRRTEMGWLIISIIVLVPTLLDQRTSAAPVLVLVANGNEITINLPEGINSFNNNNRLVNVVSNSGNNNPSVFDWIGGNGANKAPRLTIGGANQGNNGMGAKRDTAALIDALQKNGSGSSSSSSLAGDSSYDGHGESRESAETVDRVDKVDVATTTEAFRMFERSRLNTTKATTVTSQNYE
ncbi:uncharacterized protein LOC129770935 [Toxorhynchites rutilus septentrionalis]|uniref:uncharacterized protein LOC129770935 n=1 Tax=Toxorhynchites rutilus septentrionalis TaxID=329112 RepID=UPI0024783B33|nr:uncharacterized protein LOC129770935 [Toxorhynchites rutilus septentrionalis]